MLFHLDNYVLLILKMCSLEKKKTCMQCCRSKDQSVNCGMRPSLDHFGVIHSYPLLTFQIHCQIQILIKHFFFLVEQHDTVYQYMEIRTELMMPTFLLHRFLVPQASCCYYYNYIILFLWIIITGL
jgi:hypothetical protein